MTNPNQGNNLDIDEAGRIKLPPELISRYNLKTGSKIRISEIPDGLQIKLPSRLAKLYIEPTSMCNLDCRTCIRHSWNEPQGMMSSAVFDQIIVGLSAFKPVPSVFIGGFGEPLFHPDILDMIARLKRTGAQVELITNGTLLTKKMSTGLIQAGLDSLWVSIDGATPESYTDIRLGATLPKVLENLDDYTKALREIYHATRMYSRITNDMIKLNIAFVAMKRNIADLPEVINIGRKYGAEQFMVTNVIPYTREMIDETLYYQAVSTYGFRRINMPEIDATEATRKPIYQTKQNLYLNWTGFSTERMRNHCPFIVNGAGAIRWDGDFSPCLTLMHSNTSYLGYLQYDERFSRHWAVGNLKEQSLSDIWNAPGHIAFRERVEVFDFAPCTACGACEMVGNNEEDCFGNTFPTCGGCLWAQGVIQCP
jgi:MoaA/NifB/PqqE/SkfB family radical SAM enzyme